MIEDIKVLAADIDMTLTFKGADLPKETKQAFQLLHENGVMLGLATGRQIDQKLKDQWATWGFDFPIDFIVGMNGGMVYDHATNEEWDMEMMTIQEMKDIITYMQPLLEKYDITVNCEGGGNNNAMNISAELLEAEKRHGFAFVDKTGDIDGFCERRTYKMLLRTGAQYEAEVREYFLKKFSDDFQIFGTFPGTVEVMRKGIDKGTGLAKFCSWHQIDMKNVITFGDNENDNAMLEEAGWGVCLKDGQPKSKACADAITDYNCGDAGVGKYLIDHYLKPKNLFHE